MHRETSGFAPWLLPVVALWLTFTAASVLRAPVPGVNEPHYLTKARHYWQPEWCRGDLFLESANPHVVFYQTVGWLAAAFDFPTAALLGRALAFALLAIGWHRLVSQLVPERWGPLAAAWLFLLFQAAGNFAGEWLVGGVESKVFGYALAMWSAGELLARRPVAGGALLGAAVSLHPVVGVWWVVCLAGAAAPVLRSVRLSWNAPSVDLSGDSASSANRRVWSLRNAILPVAFGVAFSLPGLMAAALLLTGSDPATSLKADIIQVGIRLPHHLDPLTFPLPAYRYYALLIALWLILRRRAPVEHSLQWIERFTAAALLVAVLGWLVAAGPRPITELPLLSWRIKLLKLYPFRIMDLAVPFVLSVTVVRLARLHAASARRAGRLMIGCALAAAFAVAVALPGVDRNPSRMAPGVRADWIDALQWVSTSTPADSLLWTPNEDWAVKWYAERPEYVNYKDCPQDAAGIVEWYRRRVLLAEWARAAHADGRITSGELAELHDRTGITHLVSSRFGPVGVQPRYANRTFRVYELAAPPAEAARRGEAH